MGSNITKEGIEVKPGQVWRDLDKRMDRYCRVQEVKDGKAVMLRCLENGKVIGSQHSKVSVSRMHKGSTGWALVRDVHQLATQ